MATYRMRVIETRTYVMWSTVELSEEDLASAAADGLTPEQAAIDLAENGETVKEEQEEILEVIDRNAERESVTRILD